MSAHLSVYDLEFGFETTNSLDLTFAKFDFSITDVIPSSSIFLEKED